MSIVLPKKQERKHNVAKATQRKITARRRGEPKMESQKTKIGTPQTSSEEKYKKVSEKRKQELMARYSHVFKKIGVIPKW